MRALLSIIWLVFCLSLVWCGWLFERWAHWKFYYGPKVEVRIESLERRIQYLEDHPKTNWANMMGQLNATSTIQKEVK